MTIIGIDGCNFIIVKMPIWEYKKVAKALADMDDDGSEDDS